MNRNDIIKLDNIFESNEFNFEESLGEMKNIKYFNSRFFMEIYQEIREKEILKSDDEILQESINNFKNTLTKIIQQKDSKLNYFEIKNIVIILKVVKSIQKENLQEEIEFIKTEFSKLGKEDYIKNQLLDDLIIFSNREKVSNLLRGIINFIEIFKKIKEIEITDFFKKIKIAYESINNSLEVTLENIKESINLLQKYKYDIFKETPLMEFYVLLLGKEESILFLKKIKDSNFEIRYLIEFIYDYENFHLEVADIDNLIDIYVFFIKIFDNKEIKTDETLIKFYQDEFESNKDIEKKFKVYFSIFEEIIQLYENFNENSEN